VNLRRIVLVLMTLLLSVSVLWAGGRTEVAPAAADEDFLSQMEAPMLAERVAQGELPPVEDRLPSPDHRAVIEPYEELGRYGLSWRTMYRGPGDWPWFTRTVGHEQLVQWNRAWDQLEAGIARDWEVADGGRTYTFHLREGMKWHDGADFTANDFRFWYDNVVTHPDIILAWPGFFYTDGELFELETPDDYTVIFRFSGINAFFLQAAASGDGRWLIPHAEHYFSEFHGDINSDADSIARAAGYSDWVEYYEFLGDQWWDNPDRPSLYAWTPRVGVGDATERWVLDRNPYYWKVDTAGRQLPYLDQVVMDNIPDNDVRLLRITSGQVDLHSRSMGGDTNLPIYRDNAERGNYRIFELDRSDTNVHAIAFNQTVNDPVLREIFRERDFRAAMSLAINRQEINDLLYFGRTEPHQHGPRPEMPFYNERLGKQYTEYDPDEANRLLDGLGYTRGNDGWRRGPDGRTISVTIDSHSGQDELELVEQYWEAVGIQTNLNIIERSFMTERYLNNQHEVGRYFGGPGLIDWFLDSRHEVPTHWESIFAVPWANYYTGASGPSEEPPADVREMQRIWTEIQLEPDLNRQMELAGPLLEMAADRFDVMGLLLTPPSYGIVRNDFRNFPDRQFNTGGSYNDPGPARPEQFFTTRPR
jgi:peptide/nickel transport system substrate-binding protein